MTQKDYISNLLSRNKKSIIVGSLGTISYDLENMTHPEKYLIKGAMGCAMGFGLGLALSQKKKVIVIVGDGSYNMKAGSVSTIMKYKPDNLFIHIIQNNTYASTGNQVISDITPLPSKPIFKICRIT